MNADERRVRLDQLSELIIGCAYKVSSQLGSGFLEKVYENALTIELRNAGLAAKQRHPLAVRYQGEVVGEYFADIVVNDEILVELKAVKFLDDIHRAQCLNYLRASGHSLCLLINFGTPKAEIKRIVYQF